MTLGDIRDGVEVNPSGDLRIADIKGRVADLFDAMGGEDPPIEIARRMAQAMTDIEAGAERTAKAAALSGRRVTRLVTCGQVAAAPHVETPHATLAARLDRCRPRDPNPARRCAAPRSKTTSRHTLSTSSPRHAGRARARDAASRCRRPAGRPAASTRPYPRRPRRPYASPLRAHLSTSRHPVLTPLGRAALSHQTRLHPSTCAL